MEHRAGPILANRSLSALIVVSLVLSAFVGLYVAISPPSSEAQAIGDLIVTDGIYTIDGISQPVDGDVEVYGDGELIIRNGGSLQVMSTVSAPRSVTVGVGGVVTLEHGILTSYVRLIDSYPLLTLSINGGTVYATSSSVLSFPGLISIQNGGSLVLYDSSIEKLSNEELSYVSGSAVVTIDQADDGPVISVTNGNLELYGSSISNLPEYPTDSVVASNLTLDGESTLLAVSSYIDVDFGPAATAMDWCTHNMLVVSDSSSAHLYGSYFEQYDGVYSAMKTAVAADGESYIAIPTDKGSEDTTGQEVTDLQASGEGLTYQVAPGERMAIDDFDAGPPGSVDGATLNIRYVVDSTYDGTLPITWQREGVGSPATTNIVPDESETTFVEKTFDLYAAGVTTTDDLATLDINFLHNGGSGIVQIDSMSIVITVGPEAYVYRWVNITVGDEYGVPIPDCEISAVFTGSTTFGGQPSFYFGVDGTSSTPPESVLDYMGLDTASFGVTDSVGTARMPLLTDLISGVEYPNSLFVGTFELNGTVEQGGLTYSSTEAFSFIAYPAMTSSDQNFETTVEVEGISAESPDISKWLVVPPDLDIVDMEYYHAGDVIVASDGTLTLLDATLRMVQDYPNENTIYVDGTANFIIENSVVTSEFPLDIIVKGEGTLYVKDSTLTGVNVIAMEDAVIELDGAYVDGAITTSWDSSALIEIFDSELEQTLVLSGSAVCEVTSASIPSIAVEDDARAIIYRWIHVTVLDGGGYPLEGAQVYARFYVNESIWTSDETDAFGIAKLKVLSTTLSSSSEPTNTLAYSVNSSYWSDGEEIACDYELSVSVKEYTEPLTENITYAVLLMSEVLLPDLSIDSDDIQTTPLEVVLDTECTVSARVYNYGEDTAYNVAVDFYVGATPETGDLIGSDTLDYVYEDVSSVASILWTPESLGSYTLWVVVNDGPAFDERTLANNNASIPVTVLNYADLEMGSVNFYIAGDPDSETSIPGGLDITVSAYVTNQGQAPVTDPEMRLIVTDGAEQDVQTSVVSGTIRQGFSVLVQFSYELPIVNENTELSFLMSANPDWAIIETNYSNNNVTATLLVLDIREDFKVAVEDIHTSNVTAPIYGTTVTITAEVFNLGGTNPGNVSIEFGMVDYPDSPISVVNKSIDPGKSVDAIAYYLVNITTGGTYTLYVHADSSSLYAEKNETNNYAEFDIVIEQLVVEVDVDTSSEEYEADDDMVIDVTIVYAGTEIPVPALRGVSVELREPDGDVVVASPAAYTSAEGEASFTLAVPAEIESETYTIVCTIVGLTDTGETDVEIHGTVSGGGIPLLVWIIVIIAIAAVVIGFTVYTYVYGLGKLVECGECGEFIPAANKRCPKCGVEFEVGTMKCSECGAWVPAESAECPNCGVKFVGEEIDEGDYLEKMRKEYDEMTSKYRELAKAELGKKYTDKKFEEWWVAQPTYISFDDWLAKEEEKRKEGPVACPVCGTLNPKEATVCNRCGTVFGSEKDEREDEGSPPYPPASGQQAAPAAQQPPAQGQQQPAPKMVIRRPIDRKVVPKKIIRTPIGGEGSEGNEGQ